MRKILILLIAIMPLVSVWAQRKNYSQEQIRLRSELVLYLTNEGYSTSVDKDGVLQVHKGENSFQIEIDSREKNPMLVAFFDQRRYPQRYNRDVVMAAVDKVNRCAGVKAVCNEDGVKIGAEYFVYESRDIKRVVPSIFNAICQAEQLFTDECESAQPGQHHNNGAGTPHDRPDGSQSRPIRVNGETSLTLTFPPQGGSTKLLVDTFGEKFETWGVPTWCKISDHQAATCVVTCTSNPSRFIREDYFKIIVDGEDFKVNIRQEAHKPNFRPQSLGDFDRSLLEREVAATDGSCSMWMPRAYVEFVADREQSLAFKSDNAHPTFIVLSESKQALHGISNLQQYKDMIVRMDSENKHFSQYHLISDNRCPFISSSDVCCVKQKLTIIHDQLEYHRYFVESENAYFQIIVVYPNNRHHATDFEPIERQVIKSFTALR